MTWGLGSICLSLSLSLGAFLEGACNHWAWARMLNWCIDQGKSMRWNTRGPCHKLLFNSALPKWVSERVRNHLTMVTRINNVGSKNNKTIIHVSKFQLRTNPLKQTIYVWLILRVEFGLLIRAPEELVLLSILISWHKRTKKDFNKMTLLNWDKIIVKYPQKEMLVLILSQVYKQFLSMDILIGTVSIKCIHVLRNRMAPVKLSGKRITSILILILQKSIIWLFKDSINAEFLSMAKIEFTTTYFMEE